MAERRSGLEGAEVRIDLLGGFAVRDEVGREVAIASRKAQALLAFLALAPGKPQPREKLMGLLWSDRAEPQARSSLRQALSELRKALPETDPPLLSAQRDSVWLNPESVQVDAVTLGRLIAAGDAKDLAHAVELYRGDFLDGLDVRDEAFEDWRRGRRQVLRAQAIQALASLVELQDGAQAIATALRLLALDPLNEAAHRTLMRLYAASGERTMALKQYQACREILAAELELSPEPETERLMHEIRDGAARTGEAMESAVGPKPSTLEPSPLPDRPSIAVLPFTNMSGDAEQQYFSDGITEDIVTELSRFGMLEVVARNSAFVLRDQAIDVHEAGKALGARYLLEGSLRKIGNRIRLTTQLIDVESGKHVWAERYDRELEDIFAIQDDLTHAIVATLAGRLETADTERSLRKPSNSLVAYDYYLRALQYVRRYDARTTRDGQRLMEKAVALDPGFARAHALLAHFVMTAGWFDWLESGDVHASDDDALAIARTAVELDPDDGDCYAKLAVVHLQRREFEQAKHYFEKALGLNPHDLWIWSHYGWYLNVIGEHQQALDRLDQRESLEPYPPNWHLEIRGQALYGLERFAEAAEVFRRMTVLNPWDHAYLAACYGQLGESGKAKEHLDTYRRAVAEPSLEAYAESENYFRDPEDLEIWLDGLRKAGMKN